MDPLHSPLHDVHCELGAKFAEFGGWDMPIDYSGGGVLAEHRSVRESAGLFDVSHLGKVLVRGAGAAEFVNRCLTNDLSKITPGKAQYTMCCDDDGGVIDDLIAYLKSDFEVFLIPNAANSAAVADKLAASAPEGVEVVNQHRDYGVLAIQGPHSDEVLTSMGLPTKHDYMSFDEFEFASHHVTVCRTGYTGERGYELVVETGGIVDVWQAVLAAGRQHGISPCGLGARDTLRTEMGYPLHGHELSAEISPVMARANWAVGWKKPEFWGRTALEAQREAKIVPTVRGLLAIGRGIPRPGMVALDLSAKPGGAQAKGQVTSGTFSPTLRKGIGLALLDRDVPDGAELTLDVRGRVETFVVVRPPFVAPSTRES